MTDHRPQSRMIPVAVAGLVGVLLGALVVVLGVLAGKSPACCCNGSACCAGAGVPSTAHCVPDGRSDHQFLPPPPVWIVPQLDEPRRPVPLPGSLMLVGAGWLAWVARVA